MELSFKTRCFDTICCAFSFPLLLNPKVILFLYNLIVSCLSKDSLSAMESGTSIVENTEIVLNFDLIRLFSYYNIAVETFCYFSGVGGWMCVCWGRVVDAFKFPFSIFIALSLLKSRLFMFRKETLFENT